MNNQNRLRYPTFKQLLGEAGFEHIYERLVVADIDLVREVDLDSQFEKYTDEEIAIWQSQLLSSASQVNEDCESEVYYDPDTNPREEW
jgi:hypothetical protein